MTDEEIIKSLGIVCALTEQTIRLSNRDRTILWCRRLLPGKPPSFRALGEWAGISTERVRQIDVKAVRRRIPDAARRYSGRRVTEDEINAEFEAIKGYVA